MDRKNVRFLKTDPKARYQGYAFYFREGFCWIDVNSTYLKSRIKSNGVFDVLSMSLFSMSKIPDWYYVGLINSKLISLYVDNFINNTSHFQINDARQLPIIVPDEDILARIRSLVENAVNAKKESFSSVIQREIINDKISLVQIQIDNLIRNLYHIIHQ